MKLPISQRLLCCCAQVPTGAKIADIGCDHGYLSIHLLREGRVSYSHACDLREQPLKKAMENALRFGTHESMRFTQADGLHGITPGEVDTIVCAGMGGELICRILREAPWLKDPKYTLILQPQSGGQELRRMLWQEGFGMDKEVLVEDGGFLYQVITARFGTPTPLTPGQEYCSPQLLQSSDPLLPRYLERIEKALHQTVEGISRANDPGLREKLDYYRTALGEIRQMKEDLL